MTIYRPIAAALALLLGVASASADAGRSTIAMTLTRSEYGGGRIYLPVRFGNVMGTMRLDTGASTSRIALAPWNKDLPSSGQSNSTGASGRTTRCDIVEAVNVGLKATLGNDIARAKYTVTRCAASDGDDLLGVDFFKGSRFSLDFGRREMVFFGEQSPAVHPMPFRLLGPEQRLLGIELAAGATKAVGLFDTGAEISAVDLQFVQKHKNLFTLVEKKGKASEVGGKRFASKIYAIKVIDLGDGLILHDVSAIAYDFDALREVLGRDAPFILGHNVVSKFNWELDFTAPKAPSWSARAR
jgi:hypothetical protein